MSRRPPNPRVRRRLRVSVVLLRLNDRRDPRNTAGPAGVDPGGPSARPILQDAVSQDVNCRFGLLAHSPVDFETNGDRLMVEELGTASAGGYDPLRIRAQISAIAENARVDHLIIECDSKTHPIAFASLFLPDGGGGHPFARGRATHFNRAGHRCRDASPAPSSWATTRPV